MYRILTSFSQPDRLVVDKHIL